MWPSKTLLLRWLLKFQLVCGLTLIIDFFQLVLFVGINLSDYAFSSVVVLQTCALADATCRTTSRRRSRTSSPRIGSKKILGEDVQGRYAELKQAAANRCPRELGTFVKGCEVQYHHEVYNQSLWNLF